MTAPRCLYRLHARCLKTRWTGPWRWYHRAALRLVRLTLDAFDLPTIWRMNRVHRANIAKLDEIKRQLDDLRRDIGK